MVFNHVNSIDVNIDLEAAKRGNIDFAKELIDAGVSLNGKFYC